MNESCEDCMSRGKKTHIGKYEQQDLYIGEMC